jgi:hypothetical protein
VTRVKVNVLSDASALSLVQALVSAFAAAAGIPAPRQRRSHLAVGVLGSLAWIGNDTDKVRPLTEA